MMTDILAAHELTPGGRFDQWRPNRISYVLSDVDGTLVGTERLASPSVVAACQALRASGVRFGIATGRMRHATAALRTQLGTDGPHIHFDGAMVHDGDRAIARQTLQAPHVDALIRIAARKPYTYLELYDADNYYVDVLDERARSHWDMLERPPAGLVASSADLAGVSVVKATIVVFDSDDAEIDAVADDIANAGLRAGPSTSPRTPTLAYLNVTNLDASKGAALSCAAKHLGVVPATIAVLGDAPNDLPMFAVAGTSIAMGQAHATVRNHAHLVAPPVDRDGAAAALDALRSMVVQANYVDPGTV
ncbi:MAG: HAD family hydrolase [Nitriliruptoraceae bacterium]